MHGSVMHDESSSTRIILSSVPTISFAFYYAASYSSCIGEKSMREFLSHVQLRRHT